MNIFFFDIIIKFILYFLDRLKITDIFTIQLKNHLFQVDNNSIIIIGGAAMFTKDINLEYSVMMENKIPILIKDKSWMNLFNSVDDKGITSYRNQLDDLLNEQKQIERELSILKAQKKKNMIKILNISDEVNNSNNSKAIEFMDKCQEEITDINNKIEEIMFRGEMLPKEIREANYNLLKETIRYSYKELKASEEKLTLTNGEIESHRTKLRILLEQKHDYEEMINNTYSFLHGILGSYEMEKFDKDLLR